MIAYTESDATFSEDRLHRYDLIRGWAGLDAPARTVAFVGLNPSTAGAHVDDPTIRRCVGYAHRWGYTRLVMLNLYAYRATDPRDLARAVARDADVLGGQNIEHLRRHTAAAEMTVCAWGAHPLALHPDAANTFIAALQGPLTALRFTKDGYPAHPLYLPADVLPVGLRPPHAPHPIPAGTPR